MPERRDFVMDTGIVILGFVQGLGGTAQDGRLITVRELRDTLVDAFRNSPNPSALHISYGSDLSLADFLNRFETTGAVEIVDRTDDGTPVSLRLTPHGQHLVSDKAEVDAIRTNLGLSK